MKSLPRELVHKFIKRTKLKGMVGFLNALQNDTKLQSEFSAYCSKEGYTLPLYEGELLFHGSQKKFSKLTPNQSTGENGKEKQALVYATNNSNYAIFLAILNLKNASAGAICTMKETILSIDTNFVNGSSQLKPGHIHIVSNKSFSERKNSELIAKTEVPVLFTFQVLPSDLSVPIFVTTNK